MKRNVSILFITLLSLALLPNSGCTAAVWSRVDPEKPRWVPASEVSEAELQAEGLQYRKTRLMRAEPVDGYLVEKTGSQKFCDRLVLVAATPFTVVGDGLAFCGLLVLEGVCNNPCDFFSGLVELCN